MSNWRFDDDLQIHNAAAKKSVWFQTCSCYLVQMFRINIELPTTKINICSGVGEMCRNGYDFDLGVTFPSFSLPDALELFSAHPFCLCVNLCIFILCLSYILPPSRCWSQAVEWWDAHASGMAIPTVWCGSSSQLCLLEDIAIWDVDPSTTSRALQPAKVSPTSLCCS